MKFRIFMIDDDTELAREVQSFLEDNNYHFQHSPTLSAARKNLVGGNPDVILLDLNLPDGSGLDFLDFIREKLPATPVLIFSGYGTISNAVEAIKKGAENFLTKPLEPEHLLVNIERLIEQQNLRSRTAAQELEIANQRKMILGGSKKMQQVMDDCRSAAESNATVLISGETGTGKHLLSYFIHQNSLRSQFPMVYINCAGLSENLLESDLFGHEKGAFTGALKLKRGRVELAHHGTLFLDEIGEIEKSLQAKLLHFIEYGQFERIGGTETLRADVRIIAATNRDLQKEIESGNFREDLYYRLNVVQIQVPPLNERKEDIPVLLDYFLKKFSRELNKPGLFYSESVKKQLVEYHWPGNIRELQNAVERAVVLSKGRLLTEHDFPFLGQPTPSRKEAPQEELLPYREAVKRFKKQYLAGVLSRVGGNQSLAAKMLRIQRTYLSRLLKELEIR